ncbi:hypothetical protein LCGC14_1343430 [marine sediment metagenome]|uniref:Uncharacterized protein n=1 Tax=marine sediment metagenome TaxID=412755 RepID=A0A0F9KCZ2_9ZZZZ
MVHFQTRDHIIAWLEKHCPRKSIVRAINEGTTELLGGFSQIPPSNRSGWIVRVTSVPGRVWLVAVSPNKSQTDYEIRIPKEVPWAKWSGVTGPYLSIGGLLMYGDKPWLYETLKERSK